MEEFVIKKQKKNPKILRKPNLSKTKKRIVYTNDNNKCHSRSNTMNNDDISLYGFDLSRQNSVSISHHSPSITTTYTNHSYSYSISNNNSIYNSRLDSVSKQSTSFNNHNYS